MNGVRLPAHLEETLIYASKNLSFEKNFKDMRELLRLGYLKMTYGLGWQLTNRGVDYIHELEGCNNE